MIVAGEKAQITFGKMQNPEWKMRNLIAATLVFVTGATTSIAGVVGKGDTVTFPRAQLNDSASVQTIEWKQNMSSRSEKYIQLTATDGTSVFVQPEMAGQVQQKCDANFCAFTVGGDVHGGGVASGGHQVSW